MVCTNCFGFLLHIKIPKYLFFRCFNSSKIITGLNLDKLSLITLGDASVYDGRIKILCLS